VIVGAVLASAAIAAYATTRLAVPVLVGFLVLGMLLGSQGPGGVEFDDAHLARMVGVVGLAAILYEGGLKTTWRSLRPVAVTALSLGTVGVVLTAALTAVAAYYLFDLSAPTAFLLGAVVGSTDAAAVFATLRFTAIKQRLAHVLEVESGVNDPIAIALTIGMITWLEDPTYRTEDVLWLLTKQLGLGLVIGIGVGLVAAQALGRLPLSLAPFAPVVSIAAAALGFGVADVAGGSGFLSVYVVALFVGNTTTPYRRSLSVFHQAIAFVAQVVLFIVFGLLVFPSDLGPVIVPGLALAGVLVFVARPVAVLVATVLQRFTLRERVFLGWAGLRGAVPIVLATFVLEAEIESNEEIFNAVFFVVLVSSLLQGPTLDPLARRLGLETERRPHDVPPIEIGAVETLGADILEFEVYDGDAIAGLHVRDLGLPRDHAVIAVILRDGQALPPRGSTVVHPGDRLYVLARMHSLAEVQQLVEQWQADRPADNGH
jgi:cell volume regulation protein A